VGGYAGGLDGAGKGDLTPLLAVAGKDVVNQVVSNNRPQAQNPVANQPGGTGYAFSTSTQLTPFGSPPNTGYAFSTSTQLTPFESPPADPPPLVKGPKDPKNGKDPNALGPDGKDVTGLFPGDDPKDPIYKNLYPNNGKGPKDFTGLLPDDERPFAPKDSELVAGIPGAPISSAKPNTRTQNLMEWFKEQAKFNPANVWGLITDGLNNGAKIANTIGSAPLLLALGLDFKLPFGEVFPNFFTTVLGAGSDVAFMDMGAQVIGQSFMWAERPWNTQGEVRATPVQLTVSQTRNNLAYMGLVQSNGKFPSIANMYQAAIKSRTPQTGTWTGRNPLLGSVQVTVTVTPDGRVAVKLDDGWRWSTTSTNGNGDYNWHGGGTARNITAGFGEVLTAGKRVVVPVTSETVTNRLQPGEKRSDIEILNSMGPSLDGDPVRRRLRDMMR
jgi:hypothetical protein